jgi:hypothetical protein
VEGGSLGVGIGKDEPLVFDDFEKDAPVRKIAALGIAHDDQAGAAEADVKFRDKCGVGQRREPLA